MRRIVFDDAELQVVHFWHAAQDRERGD